MKPKLASALQPNPVQDNVDVGPSGQDIDDVPRLQINSCSDAVAPNCCQIENILKKTRRGSRIRAPHEEAEERSYARAAVGCDATIREASIAAFIAQLIVCLTEKEKPGGLDTA